MNSYVMASLQSMNATGGQDESILLTVLNVMNTLNRATPIAI